MFMKKYFFCDYIICIPRPVICNRRPIVKLLFIGGTMLRNFIGEMKLLWTDSMAEQDFSLVFSGISF